MCGFSKTYIVKRGLVITEMFKFIFFILDRSMVLCYYNISNNYYY